MADKKQRAILKKGTSAWNKWREAHPDAVVDLQGANLRGVNLRKADLSGAMLQEANLRGANLRECSLIMAELSTADLRDANLRGADLTAADLELSQLVRADLTAASLVGSHIIYTRLRRADLTGASLRLANLRGADLNAASLADANLIGATLNDVDLQYASLTEAKLGNTVFARTSLKTTKGLETCKHQFPSSLDYDTLMASGPLPEVFLKGCGFSDEYIHYLPSFWNQPLEFYSCFISYSHADKNFARRLHDALQGRGIRCWLDEHQLLPGDLVHRAVDEGIRLWDKVLLCASEASLTSWWVDKEIRKAIKKEEELWKERKQEVLSLIPLNLDGFMFQKTWVDWKKEHLTSRLAADFTGWKNDDDKFNAQLERVIKALRADPRAREHPPEPKL